MNNELEIAFKFISEDLSYDDDNSTGSLNENFLVKVKNDLKFRCQINLIDNTREYFSQVNLLNDYLNELMSTLNDLNERVNSIDNDLELSKSESKELVDKYRLLLINKKLLIDKSLLVKSFLCKFTLDTYHSDLLLSRDYNINFETFSALNKLNQIRNDTQLLLTNKGDHTKVCLDLLSMSSAHFENAHLKLFKWIRIEFDSKFSKHLNVEVNQLHQLTLHHLKQRNDLYLEALSHLTKLRRNLLNSQLLHTLSQFELDDNLISDPIKFVGELLAWLHQHAADEKELLRDLLETKSVEESLSSSLKDICQQIKVSLFSLFINLFYAYSNF